MTRTVFINSYNDIVNFVKEMCKFNADVDAVRDRYVIDAKSVMGMFSLDLSKPIDVTINTEDSEMIGKFVNICNKYA